MRQIFKKWATSLSILTLSGVLLAGCGSSTATSGNSSNSTVGGATSSAPPQTKTMRIGIGLNENSTEYKGTVKFKELAEKYSNNSIKVQLFPSGQLGADLGMTQQLQTGALESTIPSTSPVASIVPEFNLFDLPFLFKNEKVADQVLDGPVGQSLLDKLPAKGLIGLAYWENGFRDLTNSKRPIRNLQDLNGIKLRVMQNQVHLDFWQALGANPTSMSFDQVFNALQQKVIDAQENPIQTIYAQKFNEVQKYVTLSHHVYTPFVFLVGKTWFDGLTKDQQAAIKKAAIEAGQYQRQINRDEAQTDINALKQKGMEIDTISDADRAQMKDKVQPVVDKYSAKYKDIANQLFDAIKTAESK